MKVLTLEQRRRRARFTFDAVAAKVELSKGAVVNHHTKGIVPNLLDALKYSRLYGCSLEALAKGYRNETVSDS